MRNRGIEGRREGGIEGWRDNREKRGRDGGIER